jgi:hypothetical protein
MLPASSLHMASLPARAIYIGTTCHTGCATSSCAFCAISGPIAFKADGFTIATITIAAVPNGAKNAVSRRQGTMSAKSKTLPSQKILSLLVL